MTQISPKLEREVLQTLRLLRRFLWGIAVVAGLVVLLGLVGLVAPLLWSGDREPTPGNDVHASLHAGSHLVGVTEAGLKVRTTVTDWWEDGKGPHVAVKVDGMAISPERWFLYLDDDTRLALRSEPRPDGGVLLFLAEPIRGDARPRFLHFNPDGLSRRPLLRLSLASPRERSADEHKGRALCAHCAFARERVT